MLIPEFSRQVRGACDQCCCLLGHQCGLIHLYYPNCYRAFPGADASFAAFGLSVACDIKFNAGPLHFPDYSLAYLGCMFAYAAAKYDALSWVDAVATARASIVAPLRK